MNQYPSIAQRIRKNFGSIGKIIDIPDLIGMQRDSYTRFLQIDIAPEKRRDIGLQSVFKSVFPIRDFTGTASLDFVNYRFGEIKHTVEECLHRGMTYELPVRITVRLVVYDQDKDIGTSNIRDIKEQEIYFGAIPLMTDRGTFVINGTERVVVSQLHRSSGVFFDHDRGKTHSSGKIIYSSRIIPVRGSWIDMEIDPKDIVHIRIDRRRKFPITLLFRAFGYTTEDLLSYFYDTEQVVWREGQWCRIFDEKCFRGRKSPVDIHDPVTRELIVKKGRVFNRRVLRQMQTAGTEHIPVTAEDLAGSVLSAPVISPLSGQIMARANDMLDMPLLERMEQARVPGFSLLFIDSLNAGDAIRKTLMLDKTADREEALLDIYRRMRPGNPAAPEVAREFLDNLFFKSAYYDLSGVGRMKINFRLGSETPVYVRTLRREDILATAKTLVELRDTQGPVDDIDHLGNRRVRAVGELLENQYRIGLVRMERAIRERMSLQEVDALMPHDLVNPKPVAAVVKEFFGTSQLSQFMDQTNPLSETTHKRRLSALGPGGLTRERAGFEVRDVHPSHYGRICPIETPEGPNIGLIVSLSAYARVNDYGFIETPYRIVENGTVTPKIRFLSAFEEKDHPIAQATARIDETGHYINPKVTSRVHGEFEMVDRDRIELMDISPNQLVSVSASLIPFLENDDANRALMGSNMQRQAVPLMQPAAPLIGTGIEGVVARDSGVTVVARRDGLVVDADASRILLSYDFSDEGQRLAQPVNLSKFVRSNQNTCFNQRPLVRTGDRVKAGQIIADGPATENGELALGKNVTVAFMPWGGYNFEDSILVSENLVRDSVYTSVHIEEFEVVARDTKLGREEITRDIPNVGEDALKDMDDSGIIRLGAEVRPGDILVGKVTPKGETQLSPEEKLLRAIFGEKAGDVKDTSLRVPPGVEGTVTDSKIFTRRGADKDERTRIMEDLEIQGFEKDKDDELHLLRQTVTRRAAMLLSGQKTGAPLRKNREILLPQNHLLAEHDIYAIPITDLGGLICADPETGEKLSELLTLYQTQCQDCENRFRQRVSRFEKGDDLPPGVIKMVKVYVAMKRKLSVGDKMAGRHGNKGVVSRILPVEDMPYFADGRTVDMVLNPLGVPSRMNVGQILEIHLGRAAKGLGDMLTSLIEENRITELREKIAQVFGNDLPQNPNDMTDAQISAFASQYKNGLHMATPVFDGAKEEKKRDSAFFC